MKNYILPFCLLFSVISCNKKTIQTTTSTKIDSEKIEIVEEEEPEIELTINDIYGNWKLIKDDLDPNYTSFVGDNDVFMVFKSNGQVSNIVGEDTTDFGMTIKNNLIAIYDLDSHQPVNKNLVQRITNKYLTIKANYGKVGKEFNLILERVK